MKDLVKVPVEDIDGIWEFCEPLLSNALDHSEGFYDMDDLYLSLKHQWQELWIIVGDKPDAVFTTRIVDYPNKKIMEIPFVGASKEATPTDWRECLEKLEEWGKGEGAEGTVFFARMGWKKLFPDFDLQYTVMMKDYEV